MVRSVFLDRHLKKKLRRSNDDHTRRFVRSPQRDVDSTCFQRWYFSLTVRYLKTYDEELFHVRATTGFNLVGTHNASNPNRGRYIRVLDSKLRARTHTPSSAAWPSNLLASLHCCFLELAHLRGARDCSLPWTAVGIR